MTDKSLDITDIKELKAAPIGKRIGAYIIDIFIIFFLLFIVLSFTIMPEFINSFQGIDNIENMEQDELMEMQLDIMKRFQNSKSLLKFNLINLIISCLYFVVFHASSMQATVGKKLLNLKVVNNDGLQITFFQSFFRFFIKMAHSFLMLISSIFNFLFAAPILNLIVVSTTEFKKGYHDIVAKTLVIEEEKKKVVKS